jgi:hypothetical protein
LAKISDEGANSQLLFVLLEWLVERSRFAAEKNYRHWEFPFKYSTIEKVAKNLKTT